jgi:hypothetical protein
MERLGFSSSDRVLIIAELLPFQTNVCFPTKRPRGPLSGNSSGPAGSPPPPSPEFWTKPERALRVLHEARAPSCAGAGPAVLPQFDSLGRHAREPNAACAVFAAAAAAAAAAASVNGRQNNNYDPAGRDANGIAPAAASESAVACVARCAIAAWELVTRGRAVPAGDGRACACGRASDKGCSAPADSYRPQLHPASPWLTALSCQSQVAPDE